MTDTPNTEQDVEAEIAEEMGEDDRVLEVDTETGEIIEADAEAPAAPRSQAEIDALTRKLEAEAQRHEKRLREIMGEDFALLVANPTDWTPGYIFNVPEMHPTPEAVAALDALIGRASQFDLQEATDAQACEACNALGEVLTGSRKPGQETKPCSQCNGTGWKVKLEMPSPLATVAQIQPNATTVPAAPNQFQVADRWGRPAGHPHYGLEPASISA